MTLSETAAQEIRESTASTRRRHRRWPRANISTLGYALFLTINAVSLWGGVFPFYPYEFHTPQITFAFSLSQLLSFVGMFFLAAAGAFYRPSITRRSLVMCGALPIFFGSFCLVASLFIQPARMVFVILAGVLLGAGTAGFALIWQRYFSAVPVDTGTFSLLLGTACAPLIYFCMYLVPSAMTVYVVPLLLVPLCAVCAIEADRSVDFEQPAFQDDPRENPHVYRHFLSEYAGSAIAIGSLGFASGLVRAIPVVNPSFGDATNLASMLGMFLAAAIFLALWRHGTFTTSVVDTYLKLFPVTAICLLIFPFLEESALITLSGLIFMVFSFAYVVMVLQCAQISRDVGLNPMFVFGFFGGIVYLMQDLGFISGYGLLAVSQLEFVDYFSVALIGLFVVTMALFILRGPGAEKSANIREIEFLPLEETPRVDTAPALQIEDEKSEESASAQSEEAEGNADMQPAKAEEKPDEAAIELPTEPSAEPLVEHESDKRTTSVTAKDGGHLRDRLSKQCLVLQDEYRLTNRETEILEMLVRGNSYARIAEQLFISENTVRTHTRHLYAKLGVHKREEILDILEAPQQDRSSDEQASS